MLAAAQRRAKVKNVRFRQMDMSVPLDQATASLDGVLCRWGYFLLQDPEFALRETRRILKRSRAAASNGPVWSPIAPVRWSSVA